MLTADQVSKSLLLINCIETATRIPCARFDAVQQSDAGGVCEDDHHFQHPIIEKRSLLKASVLPSLCLIRTC